MDTQFGFVRTPEQIRESTDKRQREEDQRKMGLELLATYAQELIDMWPTITMRTLWKVTNKIADLKEALSLVRR
jgi:hypothetical protein